METKSIVIFSGGGYFGVIGCKKHYFPYISVLTLNWVIMSIDFDNNGVIHIYAEDGVEKFALERWLGEQNELPCGLCVHIDPSDFKKLFS